MTVLQNSPQHEPFSDSAYGARGYSAWLAAAVQARAESNGLRDNIWVKERQLLRDAASRPSHTSQLHTAGNHTHRARTLALPFDQHLNADALG